MNKFENEVLRKELEEELSEHWMMSSQMNYNSRYNVGLSYVKNTKNEVAANDGTLIMEFNSTIFAQLMHNLLIKSQEFILKCEPEEIARYMGGL